MSKSFLRRNLTDPIFNAAEEVIPIPFDLLPRATGAIVGGIIDFTSNLIHNTLQTIF